MGIEKLWTHEGRVAIPEGLDPTTAMTRLAEAIRARQYIDDVQASATRLSFSQSLFAGRLRPNWVAFAVYDSGLLCVEGNARRMNIHYRLEMWHGLLFCLFVSVCAAGMVLFQGGATPESGVTALKAASFFFGWLYGMNYLLGLIRSPDFIRDVLVEGRVEADELTAAGKVGCFVMLALAIGTIAWLAYTAIS